MEDCTVVFGPHQRRVDTTLMENSQIREMRDLAHEKMVRGLKGLVSSNLAKWA